MKKTKIKTHKATSKRFKVTANKKLMYTPQGNNHLRQGKNTRQKRHKAGTRSIGSSTEHKKLLRLAQA